MTLKDKMKREFGDVAGVLDSYLKKLMMMMMMMMMMRTTSTVHFHFKEDVSSLIAITLKIYKILYLQLVSPLWLSSRNF